MIPNESPAARFTRLTREVMQQRGMTLVVAVRLVATANRVLAFDVLDTIGSWSSSEPELRALQNLDFF